MSLMLCVAGLCLAAVVGQAAPKNYAPSQWTVVGPYPNEALALATAEGVTRAGFDQAFLDEESRAPKIDPSMSKSVAVEPGAMVDFAAVYTSDTGNKVAYALGTFESDRDQTLQALFGSDDAAKVFVNGQLVHRIWTPGRGAEPESDRFAVPAVKGTNKVLVKVDNASGGWGFYLSLFDAEGLKAREWKRLARDLGDREIVQQGGPGYLLTGTAFPGLVWRDAPLIDPLVSSDPFVVRWFDADANEVKSPEKPGAYAAYVEAKTADGKTIRRYLPFCKVAPETIDPIWVMRMTGQGLNLAARKPAVFPASDAEWNASRDAVAQFSSSAFSQNLLDTPQGAVLLAYLQDPNKPKKLRPMDLSIYSMEYLLKVRRKVQGLGPVAFRTPSKAARPAPTLRAGSL
ncbi:MAG TPA: hypothetical protein VGE01_04275, partial [Fimbriimonas sp.]